MMKQEQSEITIHLIIKNKSTKHKQTHITHNTYQNYKHKEKKRNLG